MSETGGRWITIKGTHVFVKDGQSPIDALIKSKAKDIKGVKSLNNENTPQYTEKELRTKLKNMTPYSDEIQVGSDVIVSTGDGFYGVRSKYNEPDYMTDYNPYTYGFRQKWLIERYKKSGIVGEKSESKVQKLTSSINKSVRLNSAYNSYIKDHPNSKMTLEQFKNMFK